MNQQNSKPNYLVATNIDSLSFESFERNPQMDIVCVSPVRTIVRREEEILLIRRVRKVEEIDASPSCPTNSVQTSQAQQGKSTPWQAADEEKKSSVVWFSCKSGDK